MSKNYKVTVYLQILSLKKLWPIRNENQFCPFLKFESMEIHLVNRLPTFSNHWHPLSLTIVLWHTIFVYVQHRSILVFLILYFLMDISTTCVACVGVPAYLSGYIAIHPSIYPDIQLFIRIDRADRARQVSYITRLYSV